MEGGGGGWIRLKKADQTKNQFHTVCLVKY